MTHFIVSLLFITGLLFSEKSRDRFKDLLFIHRLWSDKTKTLIIIINRLKKKTEQIENNGSKCGGYDAGFRGGALYQPITGANFKARSSRCLDVGSPLCVISVVHGILGSSAYLWQARGRRLVCVDTCYRNRCRRQCLCLSVFCFGRTNDWNSR